MLLHLSGHEQRLQLNSNWRRLHLNVDKSAGEYVEISASFAHVLRCTLRFSNRWDSPPTRLSTNRMTIPAFAFPTEADPHLPTLEGWKAELA